MRITEPTRRDIIDLLVVENVDWAGRLSEPDFLARLFDLSSMPSTDSRFSNAYEDIWKHRAMNDDWERDWVFYDPRFNILHGDDEVLLRFLAETLHPVVRASSEEAERIRQGVNQLLARDGFELVLRHRDCEG